MVSSVNNAWQAPHLELSRSARRCWCVMSSGAAAVAEVAVTVAVSDRRAPAAANI